MLIPEWAKIVALAIAFSAGWLVNGWRHDALTLAAELGARSGIDAAMRRESDIAANLEVRLKELKANETTIIREQVKIVDRPVYHVSCIDADGLRLANAAKNGTAEPSDVVP